ncbi:hypothetical protein CHELA1G2_10805 [Hyphomicrobiales bacterium]|nr:hypothetical protein CHELA1G2_10805 [Hyphomicrobiales bacterium]
MDNTAIKKARMVSPPLSSRGRTIS